MDEQVEVVETESGALEDECLDEVSGGITLEVTLPAGESAPGGASAFVGTMSGGAHTIAPIT